MSNQQLADELHKPIIRKFKRLKVYSSFKDNVWGADLSDMQSISKYNKGIRFLLCVIDLFSKYAWLFLWKTKKILLLLMYFKVFQINQKENQIKYGLIKVANSITSLLKMVKRQYDRNVFNTKQSEICCCWKIY